MARQQQSGREQQGGQSPTGQQQQQQGASPGARGTGGGTGAQGAGAQGAGATGAVSGAGPGGAPSGVESRAGERERSVPTSREGEAGAAGAAGAGSTMQRSQGGGVRGGTGPASRQPSLMSSFISGDPFAVADQMIMSPFGFMRRFSEEMDRLFADYGFGPASYGSTGYGPAGYGLTSGGGGASAGALGNREGGVSQQRMGGLQHQPGRQGSTALGRGAGGGGSARSSVWAPQIELFQRGDQIVVRADLPGLNKDDVDVEVHEGVLTISGERREQYEDRGEGFFHSERSYGSFHRSIPLPEGVSEDQINAQFRDGVLEVTIPMPRHQEQQRGRRIEIRS